MIHLIERILGFAIDPAMKHSIATLNDVTPAMIDDLRKIDRSDSWLCVNYYLEFHVQKYNMGHIDNFLREVVREGIAPDTWGYSDLIALTPDRDRAALTMDAEHVRAELAEIDGERWVCRSVDDASEVNRQASDGMWGLPGVLVRRAPYWWDPPRDTVSASLASGSISRVSEERFAIALRRWIAQRTSWRAKSRVDLTSADAHQVVEAIGVGQAQVSSDGAIALSALLKEARMPFDPKTQVRGFVGPDEWYAGG